MNEQNKDWAEELARDIRCEHLDADAVQLIRAAFEKQTAELQTLAHANGKLFLAEQARNYSLKQRAEAAEARVKELKAQLQSNAAVEHSSKLSD